MKKALQCSVCGARIAFRKNRETGKMVKVSPIQEYFIPNPDDGILYLTRSGYIQRGVAALDGVPGRKVHICKGIQIGS